MIISTEQKFAYERGTYMKEELIKLLETLTKDEIEYLYEFAKRLFGSC